MFQDVVIAALFRQFHREVDDVLLDRAAAAAGCASGIGRMSLLNDAMMAGFIGPLGLQPQTRLLDLGCGRGFLARWLHRNGTPVRFTGIDRAPEALNAAERLVSGAEFIEGDYRTYPFNESYDAVTSIEVAVSASMDKAVLDTIRLRLHEGGLYALTAASADGKHDERVANLRDLLRQRFSSFEILDATAEAAAFTKRLYTALVEIDEWSPLIAPRIRSQADRVLSSVARGSFAYTIVWGRA